MRLDWQYETCKCCTREQRVAWTTDNKLWDRVVIDYFKTRTLCLECFLRMADDREITIRLNEIKMVGLVARDKEGK